MGRRATGSEVGRLALGILFLMGAISCYVAYLCFSLAFRPPPAPSESSSEDSTSRIDDGGFGSQPRGGGGGEAEEDCCRGVEHLELWGDAVKWGSHFKLNSSKDCCLACKATCAGGGDGSCPCDSWVFCGDKQACGSRFGECWLKKQKNTWEPDQRDSGDHVMWTSGLVFGKGKGIVGLETEYGILRIKLLPDCAPRSVSFILETLRLRHCARCHFYRAESRGHSWDSEGNHVKHTSFGPPFALIQGALQGRRMTDRPIPTEACPTIKRGSVAWVRSGPEFLISLANHIEWKRAYTVFGYVLPEDMEIVEKIAQLPTKPEVWSNINVAVLEKPIPLRVRRIDM